MAAATLVMLSGAGRLSRDVWAFYRQYTQTAIHAASVAALTIFGLLVFIDPLFAGVAIAAYLGPPVVLYLLGVDGGVDTEDAVETSEHETTGSATVETEPVLDAGRSGDTDADRDDGDTDSDSDDGDSDSDRDDGDSDTDTDSGDHDSSRRSS